jgi:dienelactone hydrolase
MSLGDVSFTSGAMRCAASLYLPESNAGAGEPPVIVMAHGVGAVRAMGLAAYAERFTAAGYACLVFDYRHFGDSEGQPRHLLSVGKQLADWAAALAFARRIEEVDGDRIVAWGTSFAGGHVISTAAARPAGLVAAIVQCPFTDGIASALAASPVSATKAIIAAMRDLVRARRGKAPYMIATAGRPHTTALLSAPDAELGYLALVPPDSDFRNEVAARAVFDILRYRPGRHTRQIEVPILFAVCETDSVVPAGPTKRYAAHAPRGEVTTYADGHFAIYAGDGFERVIADQLDFLRRHVPLVPEVSDRSPTRSSSLAQPDTPAGSSSTRS